LRNDWSRNTKLLEREIARLVSKHREIRFVRSFKKTRLCSECSPQAIRSFEHDNEHTNTSPTTTARGQFLGATSATSALRSPGRITLQNKYNGTNLFPVYVTDSTP